MIALKLLFIYLSDYENNSLKCFLEVQDMPFVLVSSRTGLIFFTVEGEASMSKHLVSFDTISCHWPGAGVREILSLV